MFLIMGWAIIQSSYEGYQKQLSGEDLLDVDDAVDKNNQILFQELDEWYSSNKTSSFKWQFSHSLNYHSGVLQFQMASNHRRANIWDLMELIARQSMGSHGLVFIHDDEDNNNITNYKIWRILDGKITEHDDPFFSPFSSPHAFGDRIS